MQQEDRSGVETRVAWPQSCRCGQVERSKALSFCTVLGPSDSISTGQELVSCCIGGKPSILCVPFGGHSGPLQAKAPADLGPSLLTQALLLSDSCPGEIKGSRNAVLRTVAARPLSQEALAFCLSAGETEVLAGPLALIHTDKGGLISVSLYAMNSVAAPALGGQFLIILGGGGRSRSPLPPR